MDCKYCCNEDAKCVRDCCETCCNCGRELNPKTAEEQENKQMEKDIAKYEINDRLLVNTNKYRTCWQPSEVIIVEFSPSKKFVKLNRPLAGTTVWESLEDMKMIVVEKLPKHEEIVYG